MKTHRDIFVFNLLKLKNKSLRGAKNSKSLPICLKWVQRLQGKQAGSEWWVREDSIIPCNMFLGYYMRLDIILFKKVNKKLFIFLNLQAPSLWDAQYIFLLKCTYIRKCCEGMRLDSFEWDIGNATKSPHLRPKRITKRCDQAPSRTSANNLLLNFVSQGSKYWANFPSRKGVLLAQQPLRALFPIVRLYGALGLNAEESMVTRVSLYFLV